MVLERVIEPGGSNRQESASLLLPSIDQSLKEAGWHKRQLSVLAVGQGPGSFTGVRVAIVTARTLAQALNLPLLGVCRLECLAKGLSKPVAIVLSAHAQHFFIAAYEQDNGNTMTQSVAPCYVSHSELESRLGPIDRWALDEPSISLLGQGSAKFEPLPVIRNIAVIQAQIAFDRLSLKASPGKSDTLQPLSADLFPWSHVEPLYLRAASVTIKKTHGDTSKTHDPG